MSFCNIDDKLKVALGHHQNGALDKAATIYHKVLKKDPGHPEALHLLGVIAHQQHNYQEAVHLIKQAIKKNPAAAPYHYNLGEALYARKQFIEAAGAFRECVRLQPETAAAWNRLGLIEQNHRLNFSAAHQAYTQALKYRPDFPQALNNFGLLEFAHQRYSQATDLFQKALAIRPDYAEASHNLAITLHHTGRIDEAAKLFQKVLKLAPELPGVMLQYTKLLQNSCSWTKLQQALFILEIRTSLELENNQLTEESPLLHLSYSFDMHRNRMIAERRSLELTTSITPFNYDSKSADF